MAPRPAGTSAGPQSGCVPPGITSGAFGDAPSVVQPPAKLGTVTTLMPSPSAHARRLPSGANVGVEKCPLGPL